MKRKVLSRKKSSRIFRKTANKTHPLNVSPKLIQRGGIHLIVALCLSLFCFGCKFAVKDFTSSVGEVCGEIVPRGTLEK